MSERDDQEPQRPDGHSEQPSAWDPPNPEQVQLPGPEQASGDAAEQPTEPAPESSSWPAPEAPEEAPEATRPYPGTFGQPDPTWPQPEVTPEPAQPAFGLASPVPVRSEATPTSRLPGWTWPLVSVLALVLGIAGGAVGGALVAGGDSNDNAGVLQVQRRTAPPLDADNRSIAAVSATVLPSTVQIIAEYNGKAQGATGSGFVFDKQGHVITNNHVVAEAAGDNGPIEVIDHDGRHMTATVVGRSGVYDIAVLEVKGAETLPPVAIGSADQMHVGETVVAFGSPLGLSATVTSGIVSAVNRPVTTSGDGGDSSYINAVQTDAAINPGNSGGPLVNLQGQVIGVNSAIASLGSSPTSDEGGNIGVGFAIPIEQVEVTTDQILRTGEAKYPVIGANVQGTAKQDGARVESISGGSPASKSDLKVGDLIVKVDGKPVTGSIDVVVAVRAHQPGEKVTLTVRRDGKEREITVGLAAKTG
ncbi:MAG: trypsin-like peptidase domain-containing protein [Propionibacteriales bacterium]|nr:trypsin-like peptidase domain-containing protein [Propionibacteriales bacterium]